MGGVEKGSLLLVEDFFDVVGGVVKDGLVFPTGLGEAMEVCSCMATVVGWLRWGGGERSLPHFVLFKYPEQTYLIW